MDNIVKIKVIEVPTSRINVKSSKKTTPAILPGVSHTLAPPMDSFGQLVTGTSKSDYDKIMKDEINPPEYMEFFSKLTIKISEGGKELNLSIPKHLLMYNLAKKIKTVASEKEVVNPSVHRYYIVDENAQALKKLSGIQIKTRAYKLFAEMSPNDARDFLVLYGKDSKSVNDDIVQAKLGELIESDAEKFVSLYEDNNKEVKIVLQKLTRMNILRKEGKSYFYGDEGEAVFLGATQEMAVEFLKDPENQELYIALISELK